MENVFEFESEGDNLSMAARNKLYSNIVYSIRRHAEAIQLVHVYITTCYSYKPNNLYTIIYAYYARFAIVIESIHRIPLFIHVGANISVLSILGFQVHTIVI